MKTDGNARPCESMGYDRCQCTQKCRFSRTGKKSQGFVHWDAEFEDLTKTNPQSNTHTGIKASKSFTVCVLSINLLNIMLLHETRNSRRTVILNSMLRIHPESRGNVENLTNEGSDGFKMVLNGYRMMETTRLGYLVISSKNGPWSKVVEDPMKLEHDKQEKTKGLNLVFLMKTYYWPPWLKDQKHCSNISDLGAVEGKILQSALVEQQTAILCGPTLSKKDLVLIIDYVLDLQSNMANCAVRAITPLPQPTLGDDYLSQPYMQSLNPFDILANIACSGAITPRSGDTNLFTANFT